MDIDVEVELLEEIEDDRAVTVDAVGLSSLIRGEGFCVFVVRVSEIEILLSLVSGTYRVNGVRGKQ